MDSLPTELKTPPSVLNGTEMGWLPLMTTVSLKIRESSGVANGGVGARASRTLTLIPFISPSEQQRPSKR